MACAHKFALCTLLLSLGTSFVACNTGKSSKSSDASPSPTTTTGSDAGTTGSAGAGTGSDAAAQTGTGSGTGATAGLPTSVPAAASNLCTPVFSVNSTANPWLAGVAAGTSIVYNIFASSVTAAEIAALTDTAPAQAPVLALTATMSCMQNPGATKIQFVVVGGQSGVGAGTAYDPNGDTTNIVSFGKGPWLGKSDIKAPIGALVGVFLGDGDPSTSTPPPTLDFTTLAARDYPSISPLIGQVFFIGTGTNTDNTPRQVLIPTPATRLFLGTMDTYQWNNNVGTFNVRIQTVSPL